MDIINLICTLASIIATFTVAVLVFYLKAISNRQSSTDLRQNSLEEALRSVDRDFVRQSEYSKDVSRMESNLSSIHRRLDKLIETINSNQQQTLSMLNEYLK